MYPGNINKRLWEPTHCGWGRNSFILHSFRPPSTGDSSRFFVYVLRCISNLILCLTLNAHSVSVWFQTELLYVCLSHMQLCLHLHFNPHGAKHWVKHRTASSRCNRSVKVEHTFWWYQYPVFTHCSSRINVHRRLINRIKSPPLYFKIAHKNHSIFPQIYQSKHYLVKRFRGSVANM